MRGETDVIRTDRFTRAAVGGIVDCDSFAGQLAEVQHSGQDSSYEGDGEESNPVAALAVERLVRDSGVWCRWPELAERRRGQERHRAEGKRLRRAEAIERRVHARRGRVHVSGRAYVTSVEH